jgi:hypothetical protein
MQKPQLRLVSHFSLLVRGKNKPKDERLTIKGASLDARLQHGLLMDPRLNIDLTGDEFRAFTRLLVWAVALVSDGAFHADDARVVVPQRDVIDRLTQVGVLECDENGWHRIHSDYWSWQTSKAELDRMAAQRERDRLRKQNQRSETPPLEAKAPFS